MEQVSDLIIIVKYLVLAVGVIGLIMLVIGIYKKEKGMLTKGGYLLILAIVLFVSGHFIIDATKKRANQRVREMYMNH